ncbi:MAG: translation initiation factor IF-3 [Candidatus Magasanikbacteria bacterium]|nr:translation initiation factor IF-3 [Candidatus Magasanikbacteria bacterium]
MRISRRRYKPVPQRLRFRHNEGILAPEVRLIDEEGQHIGTTPTPKALAMARERGYDLVEINPAANPPIAKIADYGQFKYQKEKEERLMKAHAKATEVKGIRLSLRIGEHDMQIRKEKAMEFLADGDKVKVEIILRGRERAYGPMANQVLNKFVELLKKDVNVMIEQGLQRQENKITLLVSSAGAKAEGPPPS